MTRLSDQIKGTVAGRYERHLSALERACAEAEARIRELTALRGHPELEVYSDGSRDEGSFRRLGFPPKNPELAILLRPGGYIDRLTDDSEMDTPMGRSNKLSAYLEGAIRLEEVYLKSFGQVRREIDELVARAPEPLLRTSVCVATYPPPNVIGPRARAGYSARLAGVDREISFGESNFRRRTVAVSDNGIQHQIQVALEGIPDPEESVTVSVNLCLICTAFLDARRRVSATSIDFSDDDDDASGAGDEGADDFPAEDWQTDSD